MEILQDIMKTLCLPDFYFAMFRSATPVLLTTLGAMISSRSGTSNIALEGTMLISAFVGVVVLFHKVLGLVLLAQYLPDLLLVIFWPILY